MSSTNSSSVISRLKGVFARFGIPDVLVSDNGPPFGSVDFRDFTQVYGIKHTTSSPHFPQANGEVERAVQVAKRILSQRDPPLALMNYRATPHSATGYTPSQLLFGRQIRTRVPVLPCVLKPGWPSHSEVKTNDGAAKDAYAFYYNRRYGARELPALQSGDRVRMKVDSEKRWSDPVKVLESHDSPRSYIVQDRNGQRFRRNRRHLQHIPEQESEQEQVSGSDIQEPVQESAPEAEAVQLGMAMQPPGPGSQLVTRRGRVVKPPDRLDL